MKMIPYYGKAIPPIENGELLLTLNIHLNELDYLLNEEYGKQFFAKDLDEKGRVNLNVVKNVEKLYSLLDKKKSQIFTSLALRTDFCDESQCAIYGDIIIIVDNNSVKNELTIFNGDVKNIADSISNNNISINQVKTYKIDESDLYNKLKELPRDTKISSRRLSDYFEARLARALTLEDISIIYYDGNNQFALEYLVNHFNNL